ncbi:MAG: hypothetical protein ACRC62_15505 [Microcoleus sp.]
MAGARRSLPSMRKLADWLKKTLKNDIPGHPDINLVQWSEKFTMGPHKKPWLHNAALYSIWNQERLPSIETLVKLGIFLRKSGVDCSVYYPLQCAADGVYHEWMMKLSGGKEYEPDGDFTLEQESATIGHPPSKIVADYRAMPYSDRRAALTELMAAIARDVEFSLMATEFEVVSRLVREALVRAANRSEKLAKSLEVPHEWLLAILDGRLNDVHAQSELKYVVRLASGVQDLDGNKGNCEIFACLLPGGDTAKARERLLAGVVS